MANVKAQVRQVYAWLEAEIEGARMAEAQEGRWLAVMFDESELQAVMRDFRCATNGLDRLCGPLPGVTRPTLHLVD